MKGSEWFERVKHLGSNRQALMLKVLEAVQEGWAMHWPTVAVQSGPVTFYAARDYFAIGEPDDYLLVPLDPITAQLIADEWDMRMPTKGMVLRVHQAADQQLPADTLPMTPEQGYPRNADMFHVRRLPIQQQRINALMSAPCPGGTAQLLSGHKKDVVRSNVLERHPGKLAFFGWFLSNGRAIQGPYVGSGHIASYWDYSHGVRFFENYVDVEGMGRMPLDEALAHPELHKHLQAVDYMGGQVEPLRVLRYLTPEDTRPSGVQPQVKLPTWPDLQLRDGYADGDPKRPAVIKWQQLIGVTADGKYGPNTQAKTRAWQVARGLEADGRVTGNDWAAALDDGELKVDELPIPMVHATNFTPVPGGRKDVRWIVLHTMEAAEHPGTAENVAAWFASGKANAPQASAHYCIDNDSAVLCVEEENVAWHAKGGNRYGVGIELAGYARQDAKGWDDDYSQDMLRLAAKVCAGICKRWGIPAEYIGVDGLKAGKLGFCYHRDVTVAFNVVGGHYDPGSHFPIEQFLELVRAELAQLLAA